VVSKWEVLEYLRRNGKTRVIDLVKFFERHTGTTGVQNRIAVLVKQGWVKKYHGEVVGYHPLMKYPLHELYPAKFPKQGKPTWVGLTDAARKMLRVWGVRTFYELPMAKERESKMKRRKNERYRRIFHRFR
jgi:hypothetical protein